MYTKVSPGLWPERRLILRRLMGRTLHQGKPMNSGTMWSSFSAEIPQPVSA
jgi:hypothetical protein